MGSFSDGCSCIHHFFKSQRVFSSRSNGSLVVRLEHRKREGVACELLSLSALGRKLGPRFQFFLLKKIVFVKRIMQTGSDESGLSSVCQVLLVGVSWKSAQAGFCHLREL
jgi:hypothetical protein